jgi:hypothetical protein
MKAFRKCGEVLVPVGSGGWRSGFKIRDEWRAYEGVGDWVVTPYCSDGHCSFNVTHLPTGYSAQRKELHLDTARLLAATFEARFPRFTDLADAYAARHVAYSILQEFGL